MGAFQPITIDIHYDPEGLEMTIMYDELRLTAERRPNGSILYSESFDELDDDIVYTALTNLCKNLLQERED